VLLWDVQETIKRTHCSGNEEDKLEQLEKKRYLPAEKYPYLLLRFYDTYTYSIYTKNLLALCSSSRTSESIIQRMTLTFESDNEVIVYALEKVIAYARRTQQIFVAQCVWWLASIIGLEPGLAALIGNLHDRTTFGKDRSTVDSVPKQPAGQRVVSPVPRDIREDRRADLVPKGSPVNQKQDQLSSRFIPIVLNRL